MFRDVTSASVTCYGSGTGGIAGGVSYVTNAEGKKKKQDPSPSFVGLPWLRLQVTKIVDGVPFQNASVFRSTR